MKCHLLYVFSKYTAVQSLTPKGGKTVIRGKSASRHFTRDFIGAPTPIVASVTLLSCNTKAFRLDSVIKTILQTFREMLATLFTTFKICADTLTSYNDTNGHPHGLRFVR